MSSDSAREADSGGAIMNSSGPRIYSAKQAGNAIRSKKGEDVWNSAKLGGISTGRG